MSKIAKIIKPLSLTAAKRVTDDLRDDWGDFSNRWFAIGKKVERALESGVLHSLGVRLDEWIEDWTGSDLARSTILGYLQIIKMLRKLPEETIKQIGSTKCLELVKLPPSKRLDEEWIRKAKNESSRDFKESVLAERDGKRPDEHEQEIRTLKLPPMNKESRDQYMRARDRFAARAGCDPETSVPWVLLGAFLEMVEDREIEAFFEGVSAKMVGAA